MNNLSRLEFEKEMRNIGVADHFCTNFFQQLGEGYLNSVCDDFWKVWQAARSTPVTLPPLLDLEGRTGRSFIIAGAHNSAIAMCSMAITGAGYTSVCSPLLENEESL